MIPRKGLRVATFRGIGIFLHWSWFFVFALLFWVVVQFFHENLASGPASYLPAALVTTFLFFLSVLLHELAHSLVANRNGVPINRITLFVFGGVAQMGKEITSPGVEFKMAVAGPLCSYVLCLLFGGLAYAAYVLGLETVSFGFTLLAAVNFGLGTFNLIPGFPLDGGRILRSLLWHHWGDLERSTRTAGRLGQGVGALLALGGAAMLLADLFHGAYDLLFSGSWFILIGTFLIQAAASSLRQARLRSALEGRRVEEILRPGTPAVDLSASLEEVYRVYLERAPGSVIPVLGQGKLAGEVRLSDLRKVRRDLWEETPVSSVAVPVRGWEACSPGQPLLEALALLEKSGREFLWVVEEGRLKGVILRSDVRRLAGK
ncbi:site-2 protease family protein [Candidatus Solincola tengchongensis]|uniref:site-2 protease family protein n=1 Tax=Candidatus Solincola tengchongensis TaxID=2900693 RepID=UPI00257D8767